MLLKSQNYTLLHRGYVGLTLPTAAATAYFMKRALFCFMAAYCDCLLTPWGSKPRPTFKLYGFDAKNNQG
jgi:hypothetical protein